MAQARTSVPHARRQLPPLVPNQQLQAAGFPERTIEVICVTTQPVFRSPLAIPLIVKRLTRPSSSRASSPVRRSLESKSIWMNESGSTNGLRRSIDACRTG